MDYNKIENLPYHEFANIRILVDYSDYERGVDNRILIPFSYYQHYGLMNQKGEIVLKPKYDVIQDSCRKKSDVVRVGVYYTYGFNREKEPKTYMGIKWGLVDSNGTFILEPEYKEIGVSTDKRILTLRHMDGRYEVINIDGTVIVPKGKYSWIDSFDRGLCRVNQHGENSTKWGIIDTSGFEVLPVCYSSIWNFFKKNRDWITVEVADKHGNKRVGQFDLLTHKLSI